MLTHGALVVKHVQEVRYSIKFPYYYVISFSMKQNDVKMALAFSHRFSW